MQLPAYDLVLPRGKRSRLVVSSPHSGRDYPAAFMAASQLDARAIRSSEDAFVDQLFADAPAHGAPLLAARAPRAFVDLNRAPDELDPAVIEDVPRSGMNPRISAGLGVIPRVVSNGRAIYRGKIGRAEAEARLEGFWTPYHARLEALLTETREAWGEAVLLDCHSMPHEAIESFAQGGRPRPEVVLGDRFGASAGAEVTEELEAAFRAEGLCVARNAPFAGAFITQAYGRPSRGQHVVQIEIDRALYMDEARVEPGPGFDPLRQLLGRVLARMAGLAGDEGLSLAAE
ncbi:N-formylglutamate amidohydrolase [Solirhodobacter olei]|uniref:N-formylglutamate amidohydrolase n=1 Tax=Solirhodobacter olei TaxID=2493082 RepID=UPI0013E3FBD5|nr:N-formylglutamate amidohydrolase [Solirhodobacter olei]